ncbi:MAG: flagellar biosynthetic protein FliR [Halocynthiibacter sp.]
MTDLVNALTEFSQISLLTGFIVFLRVGALMAVLPVFGEQSVPQRVRLALAIGFTLVVAPAVASQVFAFLERGSGAELLLVTEVLVGLAIGIALRLFVLALQMAGAIAAQATSLSQILGTSGVEPSPAIGQLMLISGLAIAVMLGLHVRLAEVVILSYDILPVGGFPDAGVFTEWGVAQVAKAFGLAFTLAAPFLIASLIFNVAMGVINKAMPQLMVSFVGAPAIAGGALAILFLVLPVLLSVWTGELTGFLTVPFGAN